VLGTDALNIGHAASLPRTRNDGTMGMRTARIALAYFCRHHRLPRLTDPQIFTELIQHRKLHGRDASLAPFVDKVSAKQIVADRIGVEWIIPTLWHGLELPDRPLWPTPFVVKSRHGCNQTAFVHGRNADGSDVNNAVDWEAITTTSRKWMRADYGFWLDEWIYSKIPHGLLVEPSWVRDRTFRSTINAMCSAAGSNLSRFTLVVEPVIAGY
jgi:hypothetical protein